MAQQLFLIDIITDLDRAALAAYCQAYGRWVEAERKLKETPMLIKLPSGAIQQSPWLAIANKQLELMQKFGSQLGCSPVARSRDSIKGGAGINGRSWRDEDPAEKFFDRLSEYVASCTQTNGDFNRLNDLA